MIATIALAFALMLILEGLAYALAPNAMKGMLQHMLAMPEENVRVVGLATAGIGVLAIWIVRVIMG
jgi:uncharacterized protein